MIKTATYITTFTNRKINPLDPNPDDINLLDICHHLGNICRFTGAVRKFYSVAEHSCRLHDLVSPPQRLRALLHDASEGYTFDLASPVKACEEMDLFREIEDNLTRIIYNKFGILGEDPEELHFFDKSLRATEQRDLMPPGSMNGDYSPIEDYPYIRPWTPEESKYGMIDRLKKLGIEVKR